MPAFIPNLELNRYFFAEVVRPLVDAAFPDVSYGAGLIGPGSEVLGLDTEMSMDHDWGLRLFLFVREADDVDGLTESIGNVLSHGLPDTFMGFPVSKPVLFPSNMDVRGGQRPLSGPVKHLVLVTTVRAFLKRHVDLNLDVTSDKQSSLSLVDWLTIPSHVLVELVSGEVYHDGTGELTELRRQLDWYPRDLWLYLLAAGWRRVAQEEHLMGRAGFVGDELGSSLIGARLVRDVMNLCFLMERRYAPYAKWFGTSFKRLTCSEKLSPILWKAQRSDTWTEREAALAEAYRVLLHMHNELGITKAVAEVIEQFYTRPFQVVQGERIVQALLEEIHDEEVKRIAALSMIGSVTQWNDNTDLARNSHRQRLMSLYI